MPSKFLNADDTVDLIKSGISALDDKYSFENVAKSEQFKNYNIFQVSTVGNTTISLNIYISSSSGYSLPITVDWDDGNTETFTDFSSDNVTLTHTYLEERIYNIKFLINNQYQFLNGITPKTALLNLGLVCNSANAFEIKSAAFKECTNLKNVLIRVSYTTPTQYTFRDEAFAYCYNLEAVSMFYFSPLDSYYTNKPSLTISSSCFNVCYNLKYIEWEKISFIGYAAFRWCKNLKVTDNWIYATMEMSSFEYTPLNNIMRVSMSTYNNSFRYASSCNILYLYNCNTITTGGYSGDILKDLKEIHLNTTTPPTLQYVNFSANCIIYVPKGTAATYKAASGWSTYADRIVEEGAFDKLSTTGGALTGDVTTTNTTFTNTSLVTKQWVLANSSSDVICTQAEYNALPSSKLTDGKSYYITDVNVVTNGNIVQW